MDRSELVNLTCHVLSCHIRKSSLAEVFSRAFWLRFFASVEEHLAKCDVLMRLSGDFVVVGDLHGNLDDLIRIFQRYRYPPSTRFVFLGDYVDRGAFSLETLILLFTLQHLYPEHVYLIRGNHETRALTKIYGFKESCVGRVGIDVYEAICRCFSVLPVSCVLNGRIFCVHGGVSQFAPTLDDLSRVGDSPNVVEDLIWSDPREEVSGFARSDRKKGHFYSREAVAEFCERNGIELVIRAHSFAPRGLKWNFGAEGRCLTVFSSSGYEGRSNLAAVAIVRAGEPGVRTEIMSPMTPEVLARRRILIPSWALAEQAPMKPPEFVPELCGNLIL